VLGLSRFNSFNNVGALLLLLLLDGGVEVIGIEVGVDEGMMDVVLSSEDNVTVTKNDTSLFVVGEGVVPIKEGEEEKEDDDGWSVGQSIMPVSCSFDRVVGMTVVNESSPPVVGIGPKSPSMTGGMDESSIRNDATDGTAVSFG